MRGFNFAFLGDGGVRRYEAPISISRMWALADVRLSGSISRRRALADVRLHFPVLGGGRLRM